ncbi:MAG TPA: galactitol-1-phosphate 5-dehydrogenase [Ktedonobacteraceae bacterium]|nr:galactitol-1-phosphate 5-dehydrogenase [Ktedonobacteraceae bacterium]
MSQKKEMQALVWTGPRAMEMQQLAVPELRPAEVLIAVQAAGICGSELSGYLGENSLRKPPLIMGHEASGMIVQANGGTLADSSSASVGTRVTFNPLIACGSCTLCRKGLVNLCRQRAIIGIHAPGAFAQFVAVPAAQCYPLPDTLSYEVAALTEPLACSIRAVKQSQIKEGQSLLIQGAGPIGLFCLIAARAMGIQNVTVSDLSEPRLRVTQEWGAQTTINVREADASQKLQQAAPEGFDVVIDAVGATITRTQALQVVMPGGHIVFIGLHDEASPLAANYLVRQEITISGSFSYDRADFEEALTFLKQGIFQSGTNWLEERPLAAGGDAFAELVGGQAAATKIVLRVA